MNIRRCIALYFLRVQQLSHDITISRDCSGMQHELLHHFVTIREKNMDTGLARAIILPCILKIKQLRRTPSHPAEPLPFTYHEVMIMLRDAEITHYTSGRGIGPTTQDFTPITGILDPVVSAAQLHPYKSPSQQHDCSSALRSHPKSDDGPIRCELCLSMFGFSGHDAPWCPFLHPDKIKDREIKQRVLQYKLTHSIKQDHVPDLLKKSLKSGPLPQQERLPKPIARFAEGGPIDSDEESASEGNAASHDDDPAVDSGAFDYPLPTSAHSVSAMDLSPTMDVNCPCEYRAL
jgi:hypothetical protein